MTDSFAVKEARSARIFLFPPRCACILCLFLLALLFPAFLPEAAARDQDSASRLFPLEEYTLLEKGDNYQITIIYPGTGNTVADTELALWARSRANTFSRGVADIPASPGMPHTLHIYYEVIKASDKAVSVIFTSTITMSTGSPESGLTTLTFDMRDGRRLSYQDIFRHTDSLINFFSSISRKALRERLGYHADLQLLESGTADEPENFTLFSLSSTGLTLYFPPGQAAPPREGYLRVTIPLENLAPFEPYRSLWGRAETP